jgi:hypothetical protein
MSLRPFAGLVWRPGRGIRPLSGNDKQILITGATNGIGLAAAEALAALGASLAIVGRSKTALLAIINNILDLASIDAGAMTLNLGSVDIRNAMEATAFYRHPPILPVLSPILPSAAYAPTSGTCDTPQKGRTKLTSYCTVGIS